MRSSVLLIVAFWVVTTSSIWLSQCDISRCNAHGACSDGGCACFNSGSLSTDDPLEPLGHWKGSACNMCVEGWLPPPGSKSPIPQCTVYCSAQTCNGHGFCGNDTLKCECNMNNILGYWDSETNCSTCYRGFEGESCRFQTQASVPPKCGCFALGRCNATCGCLYNDATGYFAGETCNVCSENYYPDPGMGQNRSCTRQCKPSACRSSALGSATCDSRGYCICSPSQTCSGHGVCKYTTQEGPSCTCNSDSTTGYWNGIACAVCAEGYTGDTCKRASSIVLTTNKTNGSVVRCDENNANCSGRGYCDANYQMCVCKEDLGHWEPLTNCSTCAAGWTGENCTIDFKTEVLVVNTREESKSSTIRVLWILVGFAVGMGVMLIFVIIMCVKWKLAKREIVATENALGPDPMLEGFPPKPMLGNPAFSFLVSPLSSPLPFPRDGFGHASAAYDHRALPPYVPYSEYSVSGNRTNSSHLPPLGTPPSRSAEQKPSPDRPNPPRGDPRLAESPFKGNPQSHEPLRYRNGNPPLPFDKLVIPPSAPTYSALSYQERAARSPSREHHPAMSLSLKSPPRPPHSKARK